MKAFLGIKAFLSFLGLKYDINYLTLFCFENKIKKTFKFDTASMEEYIINIQIFLFSFLLRRTEIIEIHEECSDSTTQTLTKEDTLLWSKQELLSKDSLKKSVQIPSGGESRLRSAISNTKRD